MLRRRGRRAMSLLTAAALLVSLMVVPAGAVVAGDVYEPDDTMATASTIAVGETQDRTMHSLDDVDWVKFDTVAGHGYRIRLQGPVWIEPDLYTAAGERVELDQWLYKATTSSTVYLRLDCDDADEWAIGGYELTVADAGPLTTETVRVKNTSGGLLANIGVEAFWGDSSNPAQDSGYTWGYTNAQGEANVVGVGNMSGWGYLYDDSGAYCAGSFSYDAVPSGSQATTEVVLYRSGRISGTVRDDATGAGIPSVYVSAYHQGVWDTEWVGETKTNASGAYTIDRVPPNGVYLEFNDSWDRDYPYLGTVYDDPATPEPSDPIVIPEGASVTGRDVTMTQSGTIAGTIIDADTGAPAGGVRLKFEPQFEGDSGYLEFTRPDGSYTAMGLAPGDYAVSVTDDYGRFEQQDVGSGVTSGATTTQDFQVTMAAGQLRITGQVNGDVENNPGLEGIEMSLQADSGYDEGMSTVTDETGLYQLVVPPSALGYSTSAYDPNGDWLSKEGYTGPLSADGALDEILMKRAAKLSGRVVDAAGRPIKWEMVDVYGANPDEWVDGGFTGTDEDGYYTLGGLNPGSYYVEFPGIWDDESSNYVQSEFYDNSMRREGATVVELVAGETKVANATMSPDAMLFSDFFVDGRSKLGVTMNVYQKMPNGSTFIVDSSTVEMPNDDLYASGLIAGDYVVEYVADGSTLGWYGNGGTLVPQAAAKTIHIADSLTNQDINLVLDAAKPVMLDLSATALSSSSVSVSWHATDAGAMDHYEISRNGAPLVGTKATSFIDSAVAPGGTYTYSVVAYDAAGNASAPKAATVTVPLDPTLPMAAQTSASGSGASASSVSPVFGAKTRLYTMITNALGAGVSGKTVQLQQLVGGTWTTLGTALPTGVAGQYYYDVAPSAKAVYRFFVVDTGLAGSPYTVYPKVKLSASTSKSTVKAGKYFTVSGSIKPRHAKGSTSVASVKMYRVVKGKPKYVSTVKLKLANSKKDKNASVFSKQVKLSKKGTWKLVVTVKADSLHELTTLTKTVKVK